jgi:hypothetical protein
MCLIDQLPSGVTAAATRGRSSVDAVNLVRVVGHRGGKGTTDRVDGSGVLLWVAVEGAREAISQDTATMSSMDQDLDLLNGIYRPQAAARTSED